MRICHLVRQYHPSIGGLETFVASLAREQIKLGASCGIITLNKVFQSEGPPLPAHETIDGIDVVRVGIVGIRRYFVPSLPASLLALYDVVHVHGIDGLFERVAHLPAPRNQLRVVTTHGGIFHTKWLTPLKKGYFRVVSRPTLGRYDLVLANSASDRALVDEARARVEVIPNGVEPMGDFVAEGQDLLFIGRLSAHKRVERLLATLAQPPLAGVRLHIIGPDWDIKADQLSDAAAALRIGNRVVLHGYVGATKLAAIAKTCGVFVSASEYEGFGMSMIEAMSVGLIPVVQRNASFEELVNRAGVGQLVDYAHPIQCAAAIRRQLDHTSVADRTTARKAAGQYSWQAHAKITLGLYKRELQLKAEQPVSSPTSLASRFRTIRAEPG